MFLVELLNRRKLDKDNEEREIKLNYKKNKGKKNGSGSRIRTYDQVVNSHLLYR